MIKLAFFNLFRRKTRSFLALLGVAIGVAAIVVLVSIVDGLYLEFNDTVSQFQGVQVFEFDAVDVVFSVMDASFGRELEGVSNVKTAIPEIWFVPALIDGKINSVSSFSAISVYGLDVDRFRSANQSGWIFSLDRGSSLFSADDGFVLVGKKIAKDFGKFVGSTIEIDDKKFKIKGIFSGSSDFIESVIVMNLSDARELSGIGLGNVSSFTLELFDPGKINRTVSLLEFSFPEKIKAFSSASYAKEIDSVLGNFRLLVFFVAAISSIVAGVGIINTMLMSVIERFQEIGVLKAVGWTSAGIMKLVLFESLFIGVFGGIVGIVVGFVAGIAVKFFFGLTVLVSPFLVLQVFLYAVFLGIVGGIYPAFIASKMDPVQALQSE